MNLDITSFALGALSVPALCLVLLVAWRAVDALRTGLGRQGVSSAPNGKPGLEPLRFTPRLIGRIGRPQEPNHGPDRDHAHAS